MATSQCLLCPVNDRGRGLVAVQYVAIAQDDLAYDAEVSRSYLSQLEKGAFYASLKILEKLAKAFGVEPYELIVPPTRRRRTRGEMG